MNVWEDQPEFDSWIESNVKSFNADLFTEIKRTHSGRGDYIDWWINVVVLAQEHLDFKSQFLSFLENEYFPRVHMFNRDRVLFIADVLWDLGVAE